MKEIELLFSLTSGRTDHQWLQNKFNIILGHRWHREGRHWWIGPCENVGSDDGFAYQEDDQKCPSTFGVWKTGTFMP